MSDAVRSQPKWWRYRIFALTWLVYAGFYLCRKNMSVVMPMLVEEFGYTNEQLGWMLTGYGFIYMLGQFGNGMLSDRFGPRLIVGVGLLVGVASNVVMGLGASALVLFGLLHMANGYGQSTGWSGTIKNMSTWFHRGERGVAMAWWATCYSIGGVIATLFATYVATHETFLPELGWRRGFFAPAALLFVVAVLYIVFTRNKPSDAGLEDFPDEAPMDADADKPIEEGSTADVWRMVLKSPALWITGAMYFFLKMSRYASETLVTTSAGSGGPGGVLSQSSVSR
ncbi:MAG: MFS transporter [bacterium]|nr:MFS transporter [bacterium]